MSKREETEKKANGRHTIEDVKKAVTKQWKTLRQIREDSGASINTVHAAIRLLGTKAVERRPVKVEAGKAGRRPSEFRRIAG